MLEESRAIHTQFRHSLQELKSLEERLGTVTTETVCGVVFVDQLGEILYANAAAADIFGCPAAELIGEPYDLPLEPDQSKVFCFTARDGRRLTIETWALQTELSGRASWFVGLRDITEQKKAEEATARLAAIVDSSEDGIYAVSLDGIIIDWNRGAERIYGYGAAEALGCHVTRLAAPERVDEVHRIMQRVSDGERVEHFETVRLRKDGGRISLSLSISPVFENGEMVAISAIARDITDRKVAEQALRESEERLNVALDAVGMACCDMDIRTGKGIWSRQHFLLLGYPCPGEYQAPASMEMWHSRIIPEDLPAVLAGLDEARGQRRLFSCEHRVARADTGETVWVNVLGRFLPLDAPEEPNRFIGVAFDVTGRKDAELQNKRMEQERFSAVEELARREELLVRQGRFAAMGEMVANIAHQWRQPLNTLGLIVQELPVYYVMGDFSKEYLQSSVQKAMQVISHMSQTIDGFRNFLRPEKVRTVFDVKEIVEKTFSMMAAAFNSLMPTIEIVADAELLVDGYQNEYSQVILNILMNAKDAFVERRVERPQVQVRLFREGGRAVVTLTDNAGGVPQEILDRIFDPYFSTKSPEKGTGIGLYMSKIIIEKNMGGSLTACNVESGAQFRIELPESAQDDPKP